PVPAPPAGSGYALDLGYFLGAEAAEAFARQAQDRGVAVLLLPLPDAAGRVWTHVRTPPFPGIAQALAAAERVERLLSLRASLVEPDTTALAAADARP
ncbi:SPOR domain-containing protein, partial [Paracraurococcus ruber]